MPYGGVKFDNITFTNAGVDTNITVSGLYASTTSGLNVTGAVLAGLGSAAAPSFSFGSDPHSGLYSPGTNQVALATNGTGRLFITSAGLVGIGTSSPDANSRLHVSASENTSDPFTTDASIVISNLQNVGNNEAASLKFLLGSSVNAGAISCHYDAFSAGVNSSLRFYTVYQSAFNSAAERMRIDPQGRVGIGSTAPQSIFEIYASLPFQSITGIGTGEYGLKFLSGGAPSTHTGGVTYNSSSGELKLAGPQSYNYWTIQTNNQERCRVTTDGKLLVGTSTAVGTDGIQLKGPAGGNAGLKLLGGNTGSLSVNSTIAQINFSDGYWGGTGASINAVADAAQGNGDYPTRLEFSTTADGAASPTERMRIDSSGRLLVGTSTARSNFFNSTFSPSLQVEGDTYNTTMVSIVSNGLSSNSNFVLAKSRGSLGSNAIVANNDSLGVVNFQGNDGSEFVGAATIAGEVDGTPGANDMPGRIVLSTTAAGASSPTERMRITSGGLVGIGTSTPLYSFESGSSDDIQISLTRNSVGRWLLGTTSANNLKFAKEGGAEAMRFDASSRVLVGITSANTSGAKLQTADGLTFPATQVASSDPNTLDDYEEGTFTPTVVGTSSAGTATYSSQSGTYVKIGKMVTVNVLLVYSSGTGTGNLQIAGLPFAVNNTLQFGFGSLGMDGITTPALSQVVVFANPDGGSQLRIWSFPLGGGTFGAIAYDASGSIYATVTYFT